MLMLHRKNPPNQFLWNGIGGKIEKGEEIIHSLYREVNEETGIDLSLAEIQYTGVVYWNTSSNKLQGMYCFLAYPLPDAYFIGEQKTTEGIISWKKISWILSKENKQIPSNLTHFLPHMLSDTTPHFYNCNYNNHELKSVVITKLPKAYQLE